MTSNKYNNLHDAVMEIETVFRPPGRDGMYPVVRVTIETKTIWKRVPDYLTNSSCPFAFDKENMSRVGQYFDTHNYSDLLTLEPYIRDKFSLPPDFKILVEIDEDDLVIFNIPWLYYTEPVMDHMDFSNMTRELRAKGIRFIINNLSPSL